MSMSINDALDGEKSSHAIVKKARPKHWVEKTKRALQNTEDQHDRLRNLENDLLEKSLSVVGATCDFAELDPAQLSQIPPSWVKLYGQEEATKRHRVAAAAWMSSRDAPIAIVTAMKVAIGIVRARATENAAPTQLNMTMVKISAPLPKFEVLELDE